MATNIESSCLNKQRVQQYEQWRSKILVVTTISIVLAIIYSAIAPSAAKRDVTDFTFPKNIPLNSWQQINSLTIPRPKSSIQQKQPESIKSSKRYTYISENYSLTIDMKYLVGTRGNVKDYLKNYTTIAPETIEAGKIKQIAGIGYYIALIDGERVYLSSCISPRAYTSVTQEQFSRHRYSADWRLSVWLNWLRGKKSIRDRRCLWSHLSMEINNTAPELTEQTLKEAWEDWYRWWLPRFPTL